MVLESHLDQSFSAGIIYNTTNEEVKTVACGNHFVFKPKQMKLFQPDIAKFLAMNRKDLGLVDLPGAFQDPSYKETPEGKRILEEKTREGIDALVNRLREIIYNNQVSLRQDLERSNIKADPRVFATPGEIKAMELLVKYQTNKDDEVEKKVARIKELEKQLASKGQ